MAASKVLVNVDVICDLTCPYCWVGKRRLEASMAKLKDKVDFRVQLLPYELRPDAPMQGMQIPPSYQNREVHEKLRAMASQLDDPMDLTFKYKTWPNTSQAHALMEMVGPSKHAEVVEMIYKCHFTDGDVLSEDKLVSFGQRAGCDADKVRAYITNEKNLEDVREAAKYNENRVSGMIPVYFFNGEEMVVGCQSEEEFLQKLTLAAERAAKGDVTKPEQHTE